jgi:hypothetical protein
VSCSPSLSRSLAGCASCLPCSTASPFCSIALVTCRSESPMLKGWPVSQTCQAHRMHLSGSTTICSVVISGSHAVGLKALCNMAVCKLLCRMSHRLSVHCAELCSKEVSNGCNLREAALAACRCPSGTSPSGVRNADGTQGQRDWSHVLRTRQ